MICDKCGGGFSKIETKRSEIDGYRTQYTAKLVLTNYFVEDIGVTTKTFCDFECLEDYLKELQEKRFEKAKEEIKENC